MTPRHARLALTLTEVLVVLGVILGLVVLFVLAYPAMQRLGYPVSSRTACSANLSGIGKGLACYASANYDIWPTFPHLPPVADEVGRVTYAPGKIGTHRGTATDPNDGQTNEKDDQMSTTRAFWMLVRNGTASPRSFICPSSPDDQANNEDNPENFWDFAKYTEVSYGYQVPFGKHGKPGPNPPDPEVALAADKGPYSAAIETAISGPGIPSLSSSNSPEDWARYNSPNHGGFGVGEGQNVLYADAHVEFFTTPLAGWNKDNIYTHWSRADADKDGNMAMRVQGTPPTGIETPWADTDSLIYP